jgi:hypothetical protein
VKLLIFISEIKSSTGPIQDQQIEVVDVILKIFLGECFTYLKEYKSFDPVVDLIG